MVDHLVDAAHDFFTNIALEEEVLALGLGTLVAPPSFHAIGEEYNLACLREYQANLEQVGGLLLDVLARIQQKAEAGIIARFAEAASKAGRFKSAVPQAGKPSHGAGK